MTPAWTPISMERRRMFLEEELMNQHEAPALTDAPKSFQITMSFCPACEKTWRGKDGRCEACDGKLSKVL
jgi:hypothetical protein